MLRCSALPRLDVWLGGAGLQAPPRALGHVRALLRGRRRFGGHGQGLWLGLAIASLQLPATTAVSDEVPTQVLQVADDLRPGPHALASCATAYEVISVHLANYIRHASPGELRP